MTTASVHRHVVPFSTLVDTAAQFDEQLLTFFAADEPLTYQVRIPNRSAAPPGVLVYISPKPGAQMPADWGPKLDQHNLLWVGAENSGNDVHVARRVGMALLANEVAAAFCEVDVERSFLSGFSGGGRVASMMLPAYPEVYQGALFICGANPVSILTDVTQQRLMGVPMVFLTGTGDFNLEDTQFAIATYQQAGLAGAQLMIVDGLGHALPQAHDLDAALSALSPER